MASPTAEPFEKPEIASAPRIGVRGLLLLEIAAVFLVFFLHGAWPVPDVNEAYYVGKAIHFWNPDWIEGDPFLESSDSHWFFFATFGWLSYILPPLAMAWTGRLATWGLMAWAWRRLSHAVVPTRWMSILTAAAFATLIENFHMAGEWVIGGVEGKGFAYVLVFLGLEAMVRGRWNWTWICLGAASAFHVLVGGWSVVAAGFAWLCLGRNAWRQGLAMLPGLVIGGLLSLIGLVPAMALSHVGDAVSPDVVDRAHMIYVFVRLPHHLAPTRIIWVFQARFALLVVLWMCLCLPVARDQRARALQWFVGGSLAIAGIGLAIAYILDGRLHELPLAAKLLRFYWFRLSDFALPMGVALALPSCLQAATAAYRAEVAPSDSFRRWDVAIVAAVLGVACCSWFAIQPPASSIVNFAVVAGFVALAASLLILAIGRVGFDITLSLAAYGGAAVLAITRPTPTEMLVDPLVLALLIVCASVLPLSIVLRRLELTARNAAATRVAVALLLLAVLPVGDLCRYAWLRAHPQVPRGEVRDAYYFAWRDACEFVRDSDEIPRDARFLTPRMAATFKWHTGRPVVGNWKEIPQDAASIVEWYERMKALHTTYVDLGSQYLTSENRIAALYDERPANVQQRWMPNLAWGLRDLSPEEMKFLAETYDFQYIIAESGIEIPSATRLYANDGYAVYAVDGQEEAPDDDDDADSRPLDGM